MPRARTAVTNSAVASLERSLTRLSRIPEPRAANEHGAPYAALDRAAYSLLARIEELGAVRLTELAQLIGIDISTASRQVRALESQGLIERGDVQGDQRTRSIALSAVGRSTLHAVREARRQRFALQVADWSAEDLADFADLLERFVATYPSCAKPETGPPAPAELQETRR